jgi:hypothetical protein
VPGREELIRIWILEEVMWGQKVLALDLSIVLRHTEWLAHQGAGSEVGRTANSREGTDAARNH